MTAVRRFSAVVCLLGATSLAAQTPTPAPKIVPVQPTPLQVVPTTEPVTAQVSADTDRDLSDPRALKLSLDDALKTAVQNNVGMFVEMRVCITKYPDEEWFSLVASKWPV